MRNMGYKLVKKKVEELKPNTWNPNIMPEDKYQALVRCVKKDGMIQPILIQDDGMIIDGEHRWRASKEAGIAEIDCIEVSMDIISAKIRTLGFNNIRGYFDPPKKQALIDSIYSDAPERMREVLELTGLQQSELLRTEMKTAVETSNKAFTEASTTSSKASEMIQTLVDQGVPKEVADRVGELSYTQKPTIENVQIRGEIHSGQRIPMTFYFEKKEEYDTVYGFFRKSNTFEPDAKKLLVLVETMKTGSMSGIVVPA